MDDPPLNKNVKYQAIHFFIGNSSFRLSLELLTKFWKRSLKVAQQLLTFIVDFNTI